MEHGNEDASAQKSLMDRIQAETERCINCGFCESACPTYAASGYDATRSARGRVQLARKLSDEISSHKKVSIKIGDSVNSCLDCYACLNVCPTGINAGEVSNLVKSLINRKDSPVRKEQNAIARMIASSIMHRNQPINIGKNRFSWSEGIRIDSSSEFLLYTGGMYQMMAGSQRLSEIEKKLGQGMSKKLSALISHVPSAMYFSRFAFDRNIMEETSATLRKITGLLEHSGISFAYMGKKEPYPGTLLYDLGFEDQFHVYAERVYRILKESGKSKVITVDPHTYELLKYVFPENVKNFELEIYFYLDLIDPEILKPGKENMVFHEPCHFALREHAYNKPMEFLQAISRPVLPERHGKTLHCCGGPDEFLYPDLAAGVADKRISQLNSCGSGRIVTSCPICYANLRKSGNVIELADALFDNMKN